MLTKKCLRCNKSKPLSQFSKHKKSPDGLQWWCKSCLRAYGLHWQRTKAGRVSIAKSREKVCETGKSRIYNHKYYTSPKGLQSANCNRNNHRAEYRARTEFRKLMLRLRVTYPTRCYKCGQIAKTDAHHYKGYEPEHWFDVVFLCRKCHLGEHSKQISIINQKEKT